MRSVEVEVALRENESNAVNGERYPPHTGYPEHGISSFSTECFHQ